MGNVEVWVYWYLTALLDRFRRNVTPIYLLSIKTCFSSLVLNLLVKLTTSSYTNWNLSSAFARVSSYIWIISSIFLKLKYTSANLACRLVSNGHIGSISYFAEAKLICQKFFIVIMSCLWLPLHFSPNPDLQ